MHLGTGQHVPQLGDRLLLGGVCRLADALQTGLSFCCVLCCCRQGQVGRQANGCKGVQPRMLWPI
eukprot:5085083-Pyramimonas_sp.AAC.1